MKKIIFVALVALTTTACSSGPEFEVNGDISGADGKMLYFEASGLEDIVPLDPVKLKGEGTFRFKQPRPGSPELYRLWVDNKVVSFSMDSVETLQINAPYVDFSTACTVEGSENSSKIKELTPKQINLQKNVNEQLNALHTNKLGHDTSEKNLATLLKNYGEDVKVNHTFAAPNAAAAHLALLQKLNDYLVFDPLNNKDGVKHFAVVATSLNNTYPDTVCSKDPYNIVTKGMENTCQPQSKSLEIPQDKIIGTGIIDITLRDVEGNTRRLIDLKGKVVLLDFSVFQSPAGAPYNMMPRKLYNKYARGELEIYQVSLNTDEHHRRTAAGNLSQVCIRGGSGVYSTSIAVYDVRQVPSIFLIGRNSELRLRGEDIKGLETSIKSLLQVVIVWHTSFKYVTQHHFPLDRHHLKVHPCREIIEERVPTCATLEFFFVYTVTLNKGRKSIVAYMSEEGYKKLMAEPEELGTMERPKISTAIAEAKDKGDLSENAGYDVAEEVQGMLEMRVNKLKTIIAGAKTIDESKLKADSVQILNRVGLKNVKNGMKVTYAIISEDEANLKESKISVNTLVTQGLLGKKVGDIVEITVPQGKIALGVVSISI